MRFEIISIEKIEPPGKYKYIAVVHWHYSRFGLWKRIVKRQAVSESSTGSYSSTHWFYTDTFKETSINDALERFLKKQEYENQIMNKLRTINSENKNKHRR